MRTFLLITVLSILFSCKHKAPAAATQVAGKASNKTYFFKRPASYTYTYNRGLGNMENLDAGYIDTFSVGGTRFQLFSNPDSTADLELQAFVNGRWQTNLKPPFGLNGNDAVADLNGDGYDDFKTSLLRGSEVYLFDSITRQFHPKSIGLGFDWSRLSEEKSLYADEYVGRDYWHTRLFKLDGFKQTILFRADIETEIGPMSEKGHLRLYRVDDGDKYKEKLIATNELDLMLTDFDYRKFWKDFVRRGYR